MKLSDVAKAAKLASKLTDAENDLENARHAAVVRVDMQYPYPGTGWWYVTDSGGINEAASAPIGGLARDLRAVVLDFYVRRCDDLRAELRALGIHEFG